MDKQPAKSILDAALAFSRPIDVLLAEIHTLPDGKEKKDLITSTYEIMKVLNFHMIMPIVSQHPELDPDKGKDLTPCCPIPDKGK